MNDTERVQKLALQKYICVILFSCYRRARKFPHRKIFHVYSIVQGLLAITVSTSSAADVNTVMTVIVINEKPQI